MGKDQSTDEILFDQQLLTLGQNLDHVISQSFKIDEISGELHELISDKDSDILALYDIAS